MESQVVIGLSSIKAENSQISSVSAIFGSTNHTKQLNQWPTSPANHVVIFSWMCAHPVDHLSTCECLISLRKTATVKVALVTFNPSTYVLEWLVNVYICYLCDGESVFAIV